MSEARIEVSRAAARPNGAALRPGWLSATRALLAAAVGLAWGGVHGVAAAPLKIVAIGASNTAGWGVGSQKAFPAQLEALLKARGYDAHVVNAGVSGSTTSGMLGRIDSAVPDGTSLVILQPGVNDDLFFGAKEARAKNIAGMVNRLRARRIRVIVFENRIVSLADRQPDGLHFSEKGHALAAAWLLRQVLGSAAPGGDSRSSRR
ncbi:MAG TPA: GDSL-type esterase/lipase family protein [Xanthobacteraceae bacterium]|nr:GDSL-type esterase/lipase family protein [Xanthobacteraceae bacterium]